MVNTKGCGVKGCRFHAGDVCFPTKKAARDYAAPMTEGQSSKVTDGVIKDILDASCVYTPGIYDTPDYYVLERRMYGAAAHSRRSHIGWMPCWHDGRTVPGWRWSKIFDTESDKWQSMISVFRNEVEPDMAEIRAEFPGCDIDHNPLFEIGLLRFLNERGICLSDVKYEAPRSHRGDFTTYLVDRRLAEEWVVYHLTEFDLKPLSRAEHAQVDKRRRKASKQERAELREANKLCGKAP